jgi:hypothetical protein
MPLASSMDTAGQSTSSLTLLHQTYLSTAACLGWLARDPSIFERVGKAWMEDEGFNSSFSLPKVCFPPFRLSVVGD